MSVTGDDKVSAPTPGTRRFSLVTTVSVAVAVGLVAALITALVLGSPKPTPAAEGPTPELSTATVHVTETVVVTETATAVSTVTVTAAPEPAVTETSASLAPAGWVNLEAVIYTREEAMALQGAPIGFNDFLASFVGQEDEWGCVPSADVWAMHPDGYVYGAAGSGPCGGARYVWRFVNGGWDGSLFTQDMFSCEELRSAGVPQDVGGDFDCWIGNDVYFY